MIRVFLTPSGKNRVVSRAVNSVRKIAIFPFTRNGLSLALKISQKILNDNGIKQNNHYHNYIESHDNNEEANINIFVSKASYDLINELKNSNIDNIDLIDNSKDTKTDTNAANIADTTDTANIDIYNNIKETPNIFNISFYKKNLTSFIGEIFNEYDFFVFFLALGAVIRIVAPYLGNKLSDPGIVVVDEAGNFVISAISGHIGGANELVMKIAGYIDATPVITTATDISKKFSIDMFAKKFGFYIEDKNSIKIINKASLNNEGIILLILDTKDSAVKKIECYCQNYKNDIKILRNIEELNKILKSYNHNNYNNDIHANFSGQDIRNDNIKDRKNACKNYKIIIVTNKVSFKTNLKEENSNQAGIPVLHRDSHNNHNDTVNMMPEHENLITAVPPDKGGRHKIDMSRYGTGIGNYKNLIYLRPKNLIIGIGCNKNTSFEEIEQFVIEIFYKNNLSLNSIRNTATIDIKKEENGILLFSKKYANFIDFYSKEEINNFIDNFNKCRLLKDMPYRYNSSCYKYTGAYSVCEPSALLSSKNKELFICKKKKGNVTIAVALVK